ncbi:MAG TPA: DUF5063 domain-containing protein [Bacteroidales bacterium]|nr:DUF5063 domain-containing protein [Bacteroidales bacterium]
MEEFLDDDPFKSRAVIEMLTVANEYCMFFESAEKYSADEILFYFQRIAPLLYLKGSLLPMVENSDEGFADRYVTEEQWEGIFKTLRDKLGISARYYLHNQNFDTVEANLSEDIADLYQDLKDFVMQYQKNTLDARQKAVVQLKSLFPGRWGMILVNAMMAVHRNLYHDSLDPAISETDNGWY